MLILQGKKNFFHQETNIFYKQYAIGNVIFILGFVLVDCM